MYSVLLWILVQGLGPLVTIHTHTAIIVIIGRI